MASKGAIRRVSRRSPRFAEPRQVVQRWNSWHEAQRPPIIGSSIMSPNNLMARLRWGGMVFFITFLSILLLGILLISRLPDVYESEARVAIERPDSTVTDTKSSDQELLSQRMHVVINSVLSRENISKIVTRHGMVEQPASKVELVEAIKQFKRQARVEFDNVSVVNPYTGKFGLLPFGIVVAYRDESAETALNVTNELTNDVLQANQGRTELSTAFTNDFLTEQLSNSSITLANIDERIANFKNTNALNLPELYPVAIRRLDELESQIERSDQNLANYRENSASIAAELATSSPEALMFAADGTRIETASERLEQIQIAYSTARTRYTAEHPEVLSLQREMQSLQQHISGNDTSTLERTLTQTRQTLATTSERYSAQHPDVIKLKRDITQLEASLETAKAEAKPSPTSVPSNPAYNRVLVKQQANADNIIREQQQLKALNERVDKVREQLTQMPLVEKQLVELERLREKEDQSYRKLEAQLTTAQLSLGLRQADLLEHFVLIEPANDPVEPVSPNRLLLGGLLLFFAISTAAAVSLLRSHFKDSIWQGEDILAIVDVDVLLIPRFR